MGEPFIRWNFYEYEQSRDSRKFKMDGGLTMRMREGAHRDCRHFDRAKMVTNSTSLCSPCAAQDIPVSVRMQCLADRCPLPQAFRTSTSQNLHDFKEL